MRVKLIIFLSFVISWHFSAVAQGVAAVADAGATIQRATFHFESYENSFKSLQYAWQDLMSTNETLKITQEAKKYLAKVSTYVQTSMEVVDLFKTGERIANDIIECKEELLTMENITDIEVLQIQNDLLYLAVDVKHLIERAVEMTNSMGKSNQGKFSDFERLNLIAALTVDLKRIEHKVLEIKHCFMQKDIQVKADLECQDMSLNAIMFNF